MEVCGYRGRGKASQLSVIGYWLLVVGREADQTSLLDKSQLANEREVKIKNH
jgi:hypothetical protein